MPTNKKVSRELGSSTGASSSRNDKRDSKLSVPVYSLAGKETGTLELPKELFGGKVNKTLLSQAMRVYMNNEKAHYSNTKTRGEVAGSTAKMGPQKGSGHARHGSRKAPIYVHGGIALGPKSRKVELDLPKRMKKAALISALTAKMADHEVMAVDTAKATGKTKEVALLLKALNKKSVLFVTDDQALTFRLGVRNLKQADWVSANQVNIYEIIKHRNLLLTKEAVRDLESRIIKHEKHEPNEEAK